MNVYDRDIPTRKGDPAIRSLLQSLLAAELLAPSPELYLVSPWISDFPILDNRAGQFRGLAPQWGMEYISLSKVLRELARRNVNVVVASRPTKEANPFFTAIREIEGISLHLAKELHEKGLLSHTFYLAGSFNFTENGIETLEEVARLTIDRDTIGKKLLDFGKRWEPTQ